MFTTFNTSDGLGSDAVVWIFQDREGHLWFGSGGGVSRYDGKTFQAIRQQDGLGSSSVRMLLQDREGYFWFGTTKGATQYCSPGPSPPPVFIDAVVADRRYERVADVAVPSTVDLTVFEFHAVSFKTRPEAMVYRYRLKDYDKDWKTTHDRRVEYYDLPRGTYTFEVQAVDRDLVYSERPAAVTLRVHLPYVRVGLIAALGVAVALVAWQTARVVRRDRRLQKSNEDLRREMAERQRAEEERAELDIQLRQLRYLYRMRFAVGTARSPEEVIRQAGASVMEVLPTPLSAGVVIEHDGRAWAFGACNDCGMRGLECGLEDLQAPKSEVSGEGRVRYERPLVWGERERGRLRLCCGVALSESQGGRFLDEMEGQIVQALEVRELEMLLLQSARLVSLGQMTAGVAHELNQPLTAISATAGDVYLRLVEGLEISREQLKGMMQDVMGLARRMAVDVDHLRVFSRDTSGEASHRFSVNEVIHSGLKLIEAQIRSHGIALHLRLAEGLPPVSGNPHQMEQVFLNLIGNARDALDEKISPTPAPTQPNLSLPLRSRPAALSPTGRGRGGPGRMPPATGEGEVSRITDHESRGWTKGVWVRTRREGDEVVAEVEDNGVGIDEAHIGRVFEPFFTTKPADRGTGLGLSISYAIVRNHGGQIVCESRKGEGTVFRVTLPASEV